jgi:hypothetical protein
MMNVEARENITGFTRVGQSDQGYYPKHQIFGLS